MATGACNLARVRGRRCDALVVVLVAMLARLAVVFWARERFPAAGDGFYYDALARRLAEGAGYTWLWPDGAVTYAAHYPVGYPALLAAAYSVFGGSVRVAMTLNALFGAASAYCAHRLVDGQGVARWRPLAAGLSLALHPALVFYTAAVMTEGLTASLLVVAASLIARARGAGGSRGWLVGAGIALGAATLVRPQCLVLAPIFGALAVPADAAGRSRLAAAVVASAVALACVLPWTARNCLRMHRCALVSVNGGWNLLIGATTQTGAWQPMAVPSECATVWDEAGKDACFERAAWRSIGRAPAAWVARAPAKLAATLDYFGAAPWYLNASNAREFDDRAKVRLGTVETIACSLWLLGALVSSGWMEGQRPGARKALALFAAAASAVTLHAWIAYSAIPVIVVLSGWRAIARAPVVVSSAAAVIATTACLHVVFFGAGRYGLAVAPFVAMLAFARRPSGGVAVRVLEARAAA
jgi:4-amino-4-deoxy-L-arabinose transferase-like glycosyltransferase